MNTLFRKSLMWGFFGAVAMFVRPADADTISWVNAINASNPSTWYSFEETSGGTTPDVATTGSGVDGQQAGTYNIGLTTNTFAAGTSGITRGVTGLVGNAVTFNGSTGFLRASAVPVTASFSIETIVRSDSANWNINGGLGSSLGPANLNGFALHPYSGNHRVDAFVANNDAGSGVIDFDAFVVKSPGPTNITLYHHYVMTYNDTSRVISFYIDNVATSSSYTALNKPTRGSTTNAIDIAHYFQTSFLQTGAITMDEWVFYNRGLSGSEVQAHFDSITAIGVPEPTSFLLMALVIPVLGLRRRRMRLPV